MSESEPSKENNLNLAPLRRFDSDMHHATGFFELYNGFVEYLISEFQISEEAAKIVYERSTDFLPDAQLYDTDPSSAEEQMRLGLMRVVLPLMEDILETEEHYERWVVASGRYAIDVLHGDHQVDDCIVAPRGKKELGCDINDNCPVKVTKHLLIFDCMMPDFDTFDYYSGGAERKVKRVLAKVNAAEKLGLVVGNEAATIKNTYLYRCKMRQLPTPNVSDI